MTVSVTLRTTKGAALTHAELDANFTNIKSAVEDLQAESPSGVTEIHHGGTGLSVCVGAFAAIRGNAAGTAYEGATIEGTANRVTVSTGTAGKWVLSAPQDLHTSASPTFSGATIGSSTGIAKLTSGSIGTATAGTDYAVGSTGLAGGQTIAGGTLTTQDLTLRGNAADTTTGAVRITTSTASTSTTSGSLINAGGFGCAGNSYIGGNNVVTGTVSGGTGDHIFGAGTGGPRIIINGAAGSVRVFNVRSNGSTRWQWGANSDAETGSAAGTNWILNAHDDSAGYIDTPISVMRASGGTIALGGSTNRTVAVTSTTEATTHTAASLRTDGGLGVAKRIFTPKLVITEEGGIGIRAVAGESLTRGEVVSILQAAAGGGADGKAYKTPTSGNENEMPVGVVFQSASADAEVVIVTNGIAYVLPEAGITATRGQVLLTSTTTAGRVSQSATGGATAVHWRECGHWLDTGSGNGAITRAILHFN